MELQTLLNDLAHRVAEKGTESAFRSMETLAAFAADRAPGAVAALIDWTGTEVMRARAFGRVVGIRDERAVAVGTVGSRRQS